MRIFVAGINQETNTFCPTPTDIGFFERGYLVRGDEIFEALRETNSEIGGFYEHFASHPEVELIPGLYAWSVASGFIDEGVLNALVEEILARLDDAMPVEGVLLSLHGGLISRVHEDCEGYLLERIRAKVGPAVPVVSALDFHAILTEKMVQCTDGLCSFRTYPHVDFKETGIRAAVCLERLIRQPVRVRRVFTKIPLLVPVENCETTSGPMAAAVRKLAVFDDDPSVLAASLCCPHPWADVRETGISIVLFVAENGERHDPRVRGILEEIWQEREAFFLSFPTADQVLANIAAYEKPLIVVDSGDITSGGGMGDSTEILRKLLENGVVLKSVIPLVDAQSVRRAAEWGEGRRGTFLVGGDPDRGYNQRVRLEAEVVRLRDDPVKVTGLSFGGLDLNMGQRALLRVGESLHLVISEFTSLIHDPEILRSLGLRPEDQDFIVQKSHKLFRAAYEKIAASVQALDTPGFTDPDMRRLKYRNVRRPLYPLDEDTPLAWW